ncbi:MAG: long-chain fatty acid--CoA ligase [Blastocatellia bacterium]|nr:long-chain fatty acid--CoA ligase [Blastocatellia bacterium]
MTNILPETFVSLRREVGRGEPHTENEPRTIPELFRMAASKFDLDDALNYKSGREWKSISSSELIKKTERVALGLHSIGLKSGDRAAILAANSPLWTMADAGCQFAGVVDVPIYTTLAPASVKYILTDSDVKILFLDNLEQYDRVKEVLAECPALEGFVFFESEGTGDIENSMSFDDLLQNGKDLKASESDLLAELTKTVKPNDVATLIYTSGTTGEPKGVMLTHTNIISNLIDTSAGYEFSPNDCCLSVLPLSHIFERAAMYLYLFNGITVYYAESVEKVPDNLSEVMPTIFIGVPRIFEKVFAKAKLKAAQNGGMKETIFDWAVSVSQDYAMAREQGTSPGLGLGLKHKLADRLVFSKLRDFFGGRVRYCITGGAALSDDIYLTFTGAGIPIMQGYGLTETSPVVTSNNPKGSKLGTVGKPIRNVEIRTAADGEIEVTGPCVMLGYYNKDEATREAFTDDGWFRTGDIGEIDDQGYLKITDRKKELFKTSAGKYVAPSPIEQMIKASRFVSQVVLVGNERKFASALIVPNFEMLQSYAKHKGLSIGSPKEFTEHPRIIDLMERQVNELTEGLARHETVKKIALLENELTVESGELTPTLKVKRRVIDEKYRDVIDRLYAEAEAEHG